MPDRIHLTVATVIHREGRFLVVRENDHGQEVINQPAGHVEPGETLQQAALRETLEETGWRVALTGLLGFSHYRSPRNGKTYYRVSFTADAIEHSENLALDPDIIRTEWLSRSQLATSNQLRSPLVLSDIDKYLSGAIYPLNIIDNLQDGASS